MQHIASLQEAIRTTNHSTAMCHMCSISQLCLLLMTHDTHVIWPLHFKIRLAMVHMVKYCKGEVAFTMKGEVPFTCKGGLYIVGAYDKFLHSQIFKSPLYI